MLLEGLGGEDSFNLIDPLVSPVVRNTTVRGGAGNDTVSYATRTAALDFRIDPADSTMTSGAQVDHFTGVETVIGGSGNDGFLYGNVNQSEDSDGPYVFRLEGRGGNDAFTNQIGISHNFGTVTLMGGDGDDYFSDDLYGFVRQFGEAGNDTFRHNEALGSDSGGPGIDLIDFAGEDEEIDMTQVPDVENVVVDGVSHVIRIIGNDLPNHIDASAAASSGITITGGNGNDTLIGGEGPGGLGNDVINGDALGMTANWGSDTIEGNAGDDILIGGGHNDVIQGQDGSDTIIGGGSNDRMYGGPGIDKIIGGPGDDSAEASDEDIFVEVETFL